MKSTSPKATVLVPTTGDRGPLLPLSVGSILRQTLSELEVFIIGDGVSEATARTIGELRASDARVRFFNHPKHPRRGEEYRHAALREARGEIVAYLCDRDLLLPHHLETLYHHLQRYDIAANAHYDISPGGHVTFGRPVVPFGDLNDVPPDRKRIGGFKLSSVGHTLASYRSLPEGWRTTPADQATDRHMWRQFLNQPGIRMLNHPIPSFLYFKRGSHPGLSTLERLAELQRWSVLLDGGDQLAAAHEEAMAEALSELAELKRLRHRLLTVRGTTLPEFIKRLPQKLIERLGRPKDPPQW